jgi:Rps23 Pro-64 3,4-dihydroxylase Tpa1-like proline 4-hydroxylase
MTLSLNTSLDPKALAADFTKNKRLQIRNIFDDESAARIYNCLTEETEWVLGYKDGEKSLLTTDKELSNRPPDQQRVFWEKLYVQAANGFQFYYYCFPLDDERLKKFYGDHFLYRLYDFIKSEDMLSFIRQVTAIEEIKGANAQATWYRSNNFLTKHDDFEPVTSRRVAYVLNFSKDWNPDWGGYLQFYDKDGNIEEGFMPRFNSLNIFKTPMDHSVSYVPPFCQGKRLGVTGWFRDKEH